MRALCGVDVLSARKYMKEAAEVALQATCARARCGSVIVKQGRVIGQGYNTPPAGLESQRRCEQEKTAYDPKVTDKTCCIHAEVRALLDALRKEPEEIMGADLYFVRLDSLDKPVMAGEPYCTICSKLALDLGIREFYLWHSEGITAYTTEDYNKRSFGYQAQ